MPNVRERRDPDLPGRFTRKNDDTWVTPDRREWRYVRRRDVPSLTDDEWDRSVLVLRRPATGWLPCGPEGSFLGNLLHDLGPTSVVTVTYVVRYFEEDDRAYITRGVRDKRAHLALIVPVKR
jgi:hypothetical protein